MMEMLDKVFWHLLAVVLYPIAFVLVLVGKGLYAIKGLPSIDIKLEMREYWNMVAKGEYRQ